MVDLSSTIIARSDQLNSDDLMGGPITVRITRVRGMEDKEQPIAINYDGDNGKPYKPGKSMRRVLVNFWGKDGEAYVGRSMTLFRDPEVAFGGIKVGGIRISAMSDLGGDSEMALAVTRGAKRKFEVRELRVEQQRARKAPAEQVDAYVAALAGVDTFDGLREYCADERRVKWLDGLEPALKERAVAAQAERFRDLAPADDTAPSDDDDDFPGDAT